MKEHPVFTELRKLNKHLCENQDVVGVELLEDVLTQMYLMLADLKNKVMREKDAKSSLPQ